MSVRKFSTASILSPSYKNSKIWDGTTFPGYFESINTITVGSTSVASIEFTNIPQNYAHLQIRGIVRLAGTNASRYLYSYVGNASIDTGTNYSWHELKGDGTSVSVGGSANSDSMPVGRTATAGHTASVFSVFVMDILDYADTNKFKTIRTLIGYDNNGSGVASITSGNWRSTSTIKRIEIMGSGENTVQYSHFALYGIRSI